MSILASPAGQKEFTLRPGRYFVGDPCYVVPNSKWSDLVNLWYPLESEGDLEPYGTFRTDDQRICEVIVFETDHGDGVYRDQEGFSYPVDSGLIGILSVDSLDPKSTDTSLGRVIEFKSRFLVRQEGPKLFFGSVSIDTLEEDEEDEKEGWN